MKLCSGFIIFKNFFVHAQKYKMHVVLNEKKTLCKIKKEKISWFLNDKKYCRISTKIYAIFNFYYDVTLKLRFLPYLSRIRAPLWLGLSVSESFGHGMSIYYLLNSKGKDNQLIKTEPRFIETWYMYIMRNYIFGWFL